MILGTAGWLAAVIALTMAGAGATVPPASAGQASPAARAACRARGGRIVRGGLLGFEGCVVQYRDAGKACTDRHQCAGMCEFRSGGVMPSVGAKVTGRCSMDNMPFGCRSLVRHGRLEEAICTD